MQKCLLEGVNNNAFEYSYATEQVDAHLFYVYNDEKIPRERYELTKRPKWKPVS